ncbi:hypothetical protein LguiA_036245 [Lonicera macranthoides]
MTSISYIGAGVGIVLSRQEVPSCSSFFRGILPIDYYLQRIIPKEGQGSQDEQQRRSLWEELEEQERGHFSSKEDRDRRKGNHLLLEGTKRDAEDRIPCSVDADVEVKSDKRWGDDVVFKNQARGEAKTPKRFINDTICNDFHQIFLQKYMK